MIHAAYEGLPREARRELLPSPLAAAFAPLPSDPFVAAFMRRGAPHGKLREAARSILRRLVSDFDADGILGTRPMALFGPRSWEALVGAHPRGRLLDVGAGSGDVTEHARGLFAEIVTTELSGPMARRLRRRGFTCHRVDLARGELPDPRPFDVVSLLDVLDRCDRPRSLIAGARARLVKGGRMVISIPLPARPHVDVGSRTVDPDEPLGGRGESWEEALADLVRDTIEPLKLLVERVARAPYLSLAPEGVAVLDAAVLVCAPVLADGGAGASLSG